MAKTIADLIQARFGLPTRAGEGIKFVLDPR